MHSECPLVSAIQTQLYEVVSQPVSTRTRRAHSSAHLRECAPDYFNQTREGSGRSWRHMQFCDDSMSRKLVTPRHKARMLVVCWLARM